VKTTFLPLGENEKSALQPELDGIVTEKHTVSVQFAALSKITRQGLYVPAELYDLVTVLPYPAVPSPNVQLEVCPF
jgi:hypothetical protein